MNSIKVRILYSLISILVAWCMAFTAGGTFSSGSGGGGCDDCSGTLILSVHFEDGSDPSTITTGTPCGCTDGTDTTADLAGGATITSDYKSDGIYGANIVGENYTVDISSEGITGILSTGTYCADYYKSAAGNGYIFRLSSGSVLRGEVIDGAGANDNTIRISIGSEYKTSTDTFNDAEFCRICFAWDTTQAGTTDKLAVKVGAGSWSEKTGVSLTDGTILDPLKIAGGTWQHGRGYIDNIKIYSDYQHAE